HHFFLTLISDSPSLWHLHDQIQERHRPRVLQGALLVPQPPVLVAGAGEEGSRVDRAVLPRRGGRRRRRDQDRLLENRLGAQVAAFVSRLTHISISFSFIPCFGAVIKCHCPHDSQSLS